jgi:hypothetical protein
MLPVLERHGAPSALLSFGQSSTRAVGRPDDADGWRLLLRGPDAELVGVVTLRDRALSVSASLGQFVEIAGRRYGHTLLVLPEDEGLALVEELPGCEGLLIDADASQRATSGFAAATGFEPLAPLPGPSSAPSRPPISPAWPSATSPARSAAPTSRSAATSARGTRSTAPTAARPAA